jgi:hypothetical protein
MRVTTWSMKINKNIIVIMVEVRLYRYIIYRSAHLCAKDKHPLFVNI